MAPPSLIDFIISRDLGDGVAVVGCAERDCHNRFGVAWTRARFDRTRDPYLRERVPRDRVLTVWAGPSETDRLRDELAAFSDRLAGLPAFAGARPLGADEAPRAAQEVAK